MKEILEKGDSLHIIPGGTSEIPLTQSGKMRIKLANRTGIFRLALETGTPLTPVLTYGENELYSVVYPELQKWLQKHLHIFLPIPSWKSIQTWLTLCTEPLKHPIETTIGEPLYVDKIESPTSDDIENLRNLYIEKLKELYKKTKPSSYMDELEIL
jgi:1-acyl-sn-glycerol-3-phosphate acyltransferase